MRQAWHRALSRVRVRVSALARIWTVAPPFSGSLLRARISRQTTV